MKLLHRAFAVCLALLLSTGAVAQTVPVSFRVNMSHLVAEGRFDPASDFVDLCGSFNDWGTNPLTPLVDGDGDLLYAIDVAGFTPGEVIEYKFRINGLWDGTEEFPGVGNNRIYLVLASGNTIEVWYNDELPPTGPPIAAFSPTGTSIRAGGLVSFTDLSGGAVDAWQWSFEGGSPASSTAENPVVLYADLGAFDVMLIASGPEGVDTLTVTDCVAVTEPDLAQLSWWNDAVFYEIFVRSFCDSDGDGIGDLAGLTSKLDYLNDGDPATTDDLGVTGIWLMPIQPSPSEHGYDATDYRAVNPDYGTLADFETFLAEAHARGIRVIVDYVMNHCSNQHPWFQASAANDPTYRDWFRWTDQNPGYNGPWGQQVWHWSSVGDEWYYGLFWGGMPDLNYETPALKQEMFDTATWWLDTVGVDGFRLDAVLFIHEDGGQLTNTPETFAFWQEYSAHVKSVKPDALSVGEAWTNTGTVVQYVTNDRLDICFEFDLAYTIIDAVNWGWAPTLATKAQEVVGLYPYLQFATFLTNHDMDRLMNRVDHDPEKVKAAAAIYLTLPGVPFVYYGEEIGMTGSGDHLNVRRPMQWSDAPHAGFTSGTPWTPVDSGYPDWNVADQLADPNSILRWYGKLIGVRNTEPALRRGDHHPLTSSAGPVMAFLRRHAGESVLVVVNSGGSDESGFTLNGFGSLMGAGVHTLENLLDPGAPVAVDMSVGGELTGLSMDSHEALVMKLPTGSGIDPGDGVVPTHGAIELRSYPNPFNPSTTIHFELPQASRITMSIHDLAGRRVRRLASGERLYPAGPGLVDWSGRDDRGRELPSGLYLCRISDGEIATSCKVTLIK